MSLVGCGLVPVPVAVFVVFLFTGLGGDRILRNVPPQVALCRPHHLSLEAGALLTDLFTYP